MIGSYNCVKFFISVFTDVNKQIYIKVMHSLMKHEKLLSDGGLKQVKVDNWSTFFLQRLLQLYFNEELLDLNIKFHSSKNALKVHRLVVTTCTDYFLQLEREQNKSSSNNDVIIMPSDMPFECVKSIISFMYTGQLEYWSCEQNALYQTAQKMNMSVLTKLLDAQLNTNITKDNLSQKDFKNSSFPGSEIIKNAKTNTFLPTKILPEKKLPIWKRKVDTESSMMSVKHALQPYIYDSGRHSVENTAGPSRFDVPEMEDLTLGVFSSFDDITYNTKPIAQAPEIISDEDKINLKLSNNTISTMFLSFNSENNCIKFRNRNNDSSDEEWSQTEFDSNYETIQNSSIKKVRFNLDGKENITKSDNKDFISNSTNSSNSIDNHAKIIREVLKKYPHLVQHNKNIRLKIMQKESKNAECSAPGKTKVSYLVLKSDSLMVNSPDKLDSTKNINHLDSDNITGPWKCRKCNLDEQYTNYFTYRRHAEDVHGEKFDPRICEHCGYKAAKRNILLYHLYTKHNISHLKNISFPKCQECSYIALSESLLMKHQTNYNHRPSTLNSQKFSPESIKCVQCENNFTDVTELALHEITSGHGTSLNSKKKKHCCTYCGKHFLKINNLKLHIECQHKDTKKFNCFSEISTFSEPLLQAQSLDNITNSIVTSINTDQLQLSNINENVKKSLADSTYIKNFKFEDEHMVMLLNNENYERQTFKEEYPLNILTNDKIVVRNSDGEMVVYIKNCRNIESSQKFNANAITENYVHLQNNAEIVEEVVEELEDVEDIKQELEYKKIKTTHVFNKEEEELCCIEHILTSESITTNSTTTEDVIQYVEEETEILEYETCSS